MKLTILGATGSIGVSTLDVVARHPDRFEVVALTGHRQVEILAAQCRQFRPAYAVVGSAADAQRLLTPGGVLVVELGWGQLAAVTALFAAAGLAPAMTRHDLAGIARALVVRRLP